MPAMIILWTVISFLVGFSEAQLCPPAASIVPCSCEEWSDLRLYCYGVATEDELRTVFNSPDYPVNDFSEIFIAAGGFESLGADLFGPLTSLKVTIQNNANLKSLDVNLLRGPISERAYLIDISSNPLLQDVDLRIAEVMTRTDLYINALSNNAVNIIPPTAPTTIFDLSIGRNNFGELRKDMLANLPNLQYLYIHESGITTIEPGTFASLPLLKELQLHQNNLGPVIQEGVFEFPATLDSFVLDGNGIQELMPGAMSGFSESAYISLWSNDLNSFPEASFRPILERLALGGGTLSLYYNFNLPCDCSIVWLFLTPGLLDPVDMYYCGDASTPITSIDSDALIESCTP